MTSIQHIIGPHVRDLGGFSVKRVLPSAVRQTVGPFIFFDHMGPVDFAPGEGIDVRPHPHIGLATVTYLFDGSMVHRDSLGSVQTITPGDAAGLRTRWRTTAVPYWVRLPLPSAPFLLSLPS